MALLGKVVFQSEEGARVFTRPAVPILDVLVLLVLGWIHRAVVWVAGALMVLTAIVWPLVVVALLVLWLVR